MFKHFVVIISGFLFFISCQAQNVSAYVISSAGGSGSVSGLQLSSNQGELQITTLSGTVTLTQGFLQPEIFTTTVDEMENDFEVNVFPNPFTDFITLNLTEALTDDITISLFDITGKLVFSSVFKTGSVTQSFILPELTDGFYFLQFDLGSEKMMLNYKLVHL